MSQIKIFGLRSALSPVIKEISDVIQSCVVDALNYPVDKRAHRFSRSKPASFSTRRAHGALHDYRNQYVRGPQRGAKKKLIRLLFERFRETLGIGPANRESPVVHGAFRDRDFHSCGPIPSVSRNRSNNNRISFFFASTLRPSNY